MMTGGVYGLVQLVFDPFIVHPAQLVLDYPLAYMLWLD
jgi:thiamine transporter